MKNTFSALPKGYNNKNDTPELDQLLLEKTLAKQKIDVKYNLLSQRVIVNASEAFPKQPQELMSESIVSLLYQKMKNEVSTSKSDLTDLLTIITQEHAFNPVVDYLANCQAWDGQDRILELLDIMRLPSDGFESVLLRKWLWMAYAIAHNDPNAPFGLEGILVIQGPQGIGKTMLVERLGVNKTLSKTDTHVTVRNKDSVMEATQSWIVELGELEANFKGSNIQEIKAFITRAEDEYRKPYGTSAVKHPRRTAFIGTCNNAEFLEDDTGSRRYWILSCDNKFDLEKLASLNIDQLWKQVECEVKNSGLPLSKCFRLTSEESFKLEKHNQKYYKHVKAEDEIRDIIAKAEEEIDKKIDEAFRVYAWEDVTTTQFKESHPVLHNFSSEQIGKALSKLGFESKTTRSTENKMPHLTRKLPILKF